MCLASPRLVMIGQQGGRGERKWKGEADTE